MESIVHFSRNERLLFPLFLSKTRISTPLCPLCLTCGYHTLSSMDKIRREGLHLCLYFKSSKIPWSICRHTEAILGENNMALSILNCPTSQWNYAFSKLKLAFFNKFFIFSNFSTVGTNRSLKLAPLFHTLYKSLYHTRRSQKESIHLCPILRQIMRNVEISEGSGILLYILPHFQYLLSLCQNVSEIHR